MKTKELADLLDISASTVRIYTKGDWQQYLSSSAQGGDGKTRQFDDQDARVIAFITALRTDGASTREIHRTLQAMQDQNWADLPPLPEERHKAVSMVPESTAEMAVMRERAVLQQQIEVLEVEIDTLRERIADERETNETLRGDLATALEDKARLEGRLSSIDSERDAERAAFATRFQIMRWTAILFAALFLLLLAVLLLVLLTGTAG